MGRKCSVENCTSDSMKPEHIGVTFHKVPLHSDIRPKWLSLCRIKDDKNSGKILFVCSRHFLRADFCSFKGKKYMLRQGVLPSVFPWDKSRLEAIKAEVSNKKEGDASKMKDKSIKKKEVKNPDVKTERSDTTSALELSQNQSSVADSETEIKFETHLIKLETNLETEETQISNINNEELLNEVDIKQEIKIESGEKDESHQVDLFDQHQISQNRSPNTASISFTINSHIDVLDNNIWCPAKISEVDYEESEILIHFERSSNKCDEWISMSSPRLRPVQLRTEENFEVGERCMAVWRDTGKFPATITNKIGKDSYEVLFDDGFIKIVKANKISKIMEIKPAQSSPLFDPVQSTKQERRDKKRKLNVAALFSKRPRLSNPETKKNKVQVLDVCSSPAPQTESNVALSSTWSPSWENGKPVGIESTIELQDILRQSVIVPDPRLPQGWVKHLTQKVVGNSIGKWYTVIISPDGRQFKSKQEVKNYLDLHPDLDATIDMFDFGLYRNRKKKPGKRKKQYLEPQPPGKVKKQPVEPQPSVKANKESLEPQPPELIVQKPLVEESKIKQEEVVLPSIPEEPPVSLKIIFDNDAYKCPIEGCGKNFRRENLALMHVKHYHSEYTKYLDSTPNVADLAYARTVGENLDRSPGPPKSSTSKSTSEKTPVVQRTAKASNANLESTPDTLPNIDNKPKDAEIIKLLSQKSMEVNSGIQPLPSGLPSNMYPDIKLKDLLGKSEDIAMRDDIHIKNLCSSRPSQGIKTLLPVRPSVPASSEEVELKVGCKRKKMQSDNNELLRGKPQYNPQSVSTLEPQPPSQQQPSLPPSPPHLLSQPTLNNSHSQSSTDTASIDTSPPIPTAFDLAPPPAGLEITRAPTVSQFDGVIFEGGKIIKLERMKQEEIINCTCGFTEEDGLMIQCELCLCWQHAYCNNIQKESEVPEKYICYICQHPLRERQSAKYLHDQDWLKQGVLPVASYHSKDKLQLEKRFEKLKKCHDLSGSLLELREYIHTLAVKLKIAEAKNHPKLYLWSKPWQKLKLFEKSVIKEEDEIVKPKLESGDHQYMKNGMEIGKQESSDSMLMMILKSGKEEMPMLNMASNMVPIIPRPEAAIDSDDCRLNLLDHIAHSEDLVDERLDDFEKQLDVLEKGMELEMDNDYPKTRQTLQQLMRDLDILKRFSELPMI